MAGSQGHRDIIGIYCRMWLDSPIGRNNRNQNSPWLWAFARELPSIVDQCPSSNTGSTRSRRFSMASLDCRTPPNLICIMDLHCSKPTRNRRHLDISSETCTIPGPAPMMPWESNKSSQESISCIVHQHITATDFKPRDTKGPTLCSMSASAAASTDVSPVLTDADWLSQTSRPGSGTFPATTAAPQWSLPSKINMMKQRCSWEWHWDHHYAELVR